MISHTFFRRKRFRIPGRRLFWRQTSWRARWPRGQLWIWLQQWWNWSGNWLWCWRWLFGVWYIPRGRGGGGRGTPLYKPYRYVPPHRVGSLRRFGLKTVIHALCLFWSGIRHGFRGNCGVDELIYRFHFKWVRKKEKYAKYFLLAL